MWNCNGLTENKLSNEDFLNIIDGNGIVILSETWTNSSSNINIDGYKCFNYFRKYKHKNAKRNSGGIVVYVKNEICGGITVVRNHYDSIIWLKIDKNFFKLKNDIYLCGLYFWSDDSPINNIIDTNLFDVLSDDIFYFESLGKILIAGDFNCRAGDRPDYILHDNIIRDLDPDDYLNDEGSGRASQDKICNGRGIRLLDFCKATNMRIMNGRLGIDNSNGAYTYFCRNTCSTIDYLLARDIDYKLLRNFSVGHFNQFSDHAPLLFDILIHNKINPSRSHSSGSSYVQYKWRDENKNYFRRDLIANLNNINSIFNISRNPLPYEIDRLIDEFSSLVLNTAKPYFGKQCSGNRNGEKKFDNEWFNHDCYLAKMAYVDALTNFNVNKSDVNRNILCDKKRIYKTLICKTKRAYTTRKAQELYDLRNKQPKEFWSKFRAKTSNPACDIDIENFKDYFAGLFNDIKSAQIDEIDDFANNSDFNINDPTYESLNAVITHDEVRSAVKCLKRNKAACPSDNMINEFFIETLDILVGHLTDLFNTVLDGDYFPASWASGFIVPIHKKGDINDTNNYRGITLVSNLGKIFTSVLTKRVETWFDTNNILSDAQFGFRKGSSTEDAIFVLHNLIESALFKKLRLPCAFIDLKKAFDSVYRNALWVKLFRMGLDGKILKIFKAMYSVVKSCVKHCNSFSDFFDISIGLRQGQNNSPILFSLFLEDLELFLQQGSDCGIDIYEICIMLLLFADDMVILGNSVEDLQSSLNRLCEYCKIWGLEVNTDKTKVVVFRNRGSVRHNERWYYNNEPLEIVDNFNYLGVVLNYTGSFVLNNQFVVGKALKAMHILLKNINKYDVPPKISLQLFDSFVGSILSYGCPVWGLSKSKEVERIHLKFCKSILGVKQSSCTAAVYGELGRYPLYINRYVQIIKYWFKAKDSKNIILNSLYRESVQLCLNGYNSWANKIKNVLEENGFLDVWLHPEKYEPNTFICLFKQRLIDVFLHKWRGDINTSSKLIPVFSHLHNEFGMADYLNMLFNKTNRKCLTRLRMSSHNLFIETKRYGPNRTPRNERFCTLCDLHELEDEFHFVIKCSCYNDIRNQFLKRYYYCRPNMFKFIELINNQNKTIIVNLCKYLLQANNRRTLLINDRV